MRRPITTLIASGIFIALIASGGPAAGQGPVAERGHGLTEAEAAAGWLSLYDGKTTFGWDGARLVDGRLVGGHDHDRVRRLRTPGRRRTRRHARRRGKAVTVEAGPARDP